jgi:Glycosyl hydrolase family 115
LDRWAKEKLSDFGRLWAAREFRSRYASEIADIVARYAKFNARRKPDLFEPNTYSQVNYREAETVAQQFQILSRKRRVVALLHQHASRRQVESP